MFRVAELKPELFRLWKYSFIFCSVCDLWPLCECVNKTECICLSPYLLSCSHPHTLHCLSYLCRPFIWDPRLQQQQSPSNKTAHNSHLWTSKTVENLTVLLVLFSADEWSPISGAAEERGLQRFSLSHLRAPSGARLASAASTRAHPATASTSSVIHDGEAESGRLPLPQLVWLQATGKQQPKRPLGGVSCVELKRVRDSELAVGLWLTPVVFEFSCSVHSGWSYVANADADGSYRLNK